MITELRLYVPTLGNSEALLHRLQTSSLALFKKLGINMKELWVDADTGDIWYTVVWNSREEMKDRWNQFRTNPGWLRDKTDMEKNGPLMASMKSYVLTSPTPVSDSKSR